MKIAYISRQHWPSFTPTASFVSFNAHSLAKAGVEMFLYVGRGSKLAPNGLLQDNYGLKPLGNLHIKPIGHYKGSSYVFYLLTFLNLLVGNREKKINAIITRDVGFLPFLCCLAKRTKSLAILECHNYFWEVTDNAYMQKAMAQRKKYMKIERKWLPKIDAVLCILSPMAELYKKHIDNQKVFVALPGVLPLNPLPAKKSSIFWIGYIGSYHEQRDFETVFAALAKVEDTNVRLMFVGGKEADWPRLHGLIHKYSLQNRVEITGWLSYSKMLEHIGQFSIGIVPMVDNLYNRSLTAPMKILDYLHFGLPIIAADLPSAWEFVGRNGAGVFYEAGNSDELAELIRYLNENRAVLSDMSRASLAQGVNISWDNRANRIIDIINGMPKIEA